MARLFSRVPLFGMFKAKPKGKPPIWGATPKRLQALASEVQEALAHTTLPRFAPCFWEKPAQPPDVARVIVGYGSPRIPLPEVPRIAKSHLVNLFL